jgi:hypothetical protein
MNIVTAMVSVLLITAATAQTPPQVSIPTDQLAEVFEAEQPKTFEGAVVAYDWTTRNYMEGARIENFIFKTDTTKLSGKQKPTFLRVILIWHPADKTRLLPEDFYATDRKWLITVRATTPFDFVRRYCEKETTPTLMADVGEGRKVELRRYVDPAVLPPNAGIPENFERALANPPTSPPMPDPRSMRCTYLEKVASVRH